MLRDCVVLAIEGAHASGKTTLAYGLAAYYRECGIHVGVVEEPARSSPFIEEIVVHGRGTFDLETEVDLFAAQLSADSRFGSRVLAADNLEPDDVASHLLACDALVQPYPDGVSSRRTSVMAGLALGVPIATNEGFLSEPVWRESRGVELVRSLDDLADATDHLLRDPERARSFSERGRALYAAKFSLNRTVAILRGSTSSEPAS